MAPTREQLARLDRNQPHKGSNEEWKHPHDPDARVTKMRDGRTDLGHTVEHAVDLTSGAVVAVNLAPGDAGDTATVVETVCEAGEQIATVASETRNESMNPEGPQEAVLDKGYHSNEMLVRSAAWEVRSYASEPERGRRRWEGKGEASGGQPAADSGRVTPIHSRRSRLNRRIATGGGIWLFRRVS